MYWLFSLAGALVVLALLFFVFGKSFGRTEEFPPRLDSPGLQEPWKSVVNAPITSTSIREVKFAQELRGYNQAQVDEYLDRISARLKELEDQVAQGQVAQGQTAQAQTTQCQTVQGRFGTSSSNAIHSSTTNAEYPLKADLQDPPAAGGANPAAPR